MVERALTWSGTEEALYQPYVARLKAQLAVLRDKLKARGGRVLFFSPPPSPNFDVGTCMLKAYARDDGADICSFSLTDRSAFSSILHALMNSLTETVEVIDLEPLICPDSHCMPIRDGVILYRDQEHLRNEGARLLGRMYEEK
jgi:hypothetical protein